MIKVKNIHSNIDESQIKLTLCWLIRRQLVMDCTQLRRMLWTSQGWIANDKMTKTQVSWWQFCICRLGRLQTESTCELFSHAQETQRFLFTSQATSRNCYQWHVSVGHMSRPPLIAHLLRGCATWPTAWRSSRRRRPCCWSAWGEGWTRPGLGTGPTWRPARSGFWKLTCGWCGRLQPPPS